MPKFFCGIDSGGTSTRAVVADASGSQAGKGHAAGANPNHNGWEAMGANLLEAVKVASAQAGCDISEISSVFLGIGSVITAADRASAAAVCQSWGLAPGFFASADHDIRIALEGGLSGRPGIAVIAGTGSSCYGRNGDGESWQSGGWDYLLNDFGSGFDLAQRGMVAACQSADGRLGHTVLKELFFNRLGVDEVVDFAVKVHRPALARHEVAALAPIVLQAAQDGDTVAMALVDDAARELARMVDAVTTRLFSLRNPQVVLLGGVFEKSEFYREKVRHAVLDNIPKAGFSDPESPAVVGAWSLAAENAGSQVTAETLSKLSSLK